MSQEQKYEDVTVCDGKYTVRMFENGDSRALRYGEPWPAYGDSSLGNLETNLAREVQMLRAKLMVAVDGLAEFGVLDGSLDNVASPEVLAARVRTISVKLLESMEKAGR